LDVRSRDQYSFDVGGLFLWKIAAIDRKAVTSTITGTTGCVQERCEFSLFKI
jgi:hypothetical protein